MRMRGKENEARYRKRDQHEEFAGSRCGPKCGYAARSSFMLYRCELMFEGAYAPKF